MYCFKSALKQTKEHNKRFAMGKIILALSQIHRLPQVFSILAKVHHFVQANNNYKLIIYTYCSFYYLDTS